MKAREVRKGDGAKGNELQVKEPSVSMQLALEAQLLVEGWLHSFTF